jgi:hypothetical protein
MDVWWYNPSTFEWERLTYEYDGHMIPAEHPQYNPDECGHATLESCVVKGKSTWWMASMLSGCWADSTGTRETSLSDLKRRFAR